MIEQIARTCHEVNRAYCESLNDHSQVAWEQAPKWQKDSTISGVEFLLSNPNKGPRDSHENWVKDKLTAGWRQGPIKNPETKEHPCITEYENLTDSQQLKDSLFLAVVRSFST